MNPFIDELFNELDIGFHKVIGRSEQDDFTAIKHGKVVPNSQRRGWGWAVTKRVLRCCSEIHSSLNLSFVETLISRDTRTTCFCERERGITSAT